MNSGLLGGALLLGLAFMTAVAPPAQLLAPAPAKALAILVPEPLFCPECAQQLYGLLAHGNCPHCLYPLAAHYLAIAPGGKWLLHPQDPDVRATLVCQHDLRLIYGLPWDQ